MPNLIYYFMLATKNQNGINKESKFQQNIIQICRLFLNIKSQNNLKVFQTILI